MHGFTKPFEKPIVILFILIFSIIVCINFGSYSFWFDEYCTVSFIRNGRSILDLLKIFITDEVTNPPLYDIFMYYWYRMVPHTQGWLLLPNLIFYVTGAVCIGKTPFIKEKHGTIACLVLCFINSFAIQFLIYELRSYAMLFMFSAVVLYMHEVYKKQDDQKNGTGLALSMLCLSFTHYFGLLTVSGFGIYDLVRAVREKKYKILLPYIPAAVTGGAYLGMVMYFKNRSLASSWVGKPDLKSVLGMVHCLFGRNILYAVVFLILMVFYVLSAVYGKNREKLTGYGLDGCIKCMFIIVYVISTVFAYSFFINPGGSIFVARYFTAIIPEVIYLFTVFEVFLSERLMEKYGQLVAMIPLAVIITAGIAGGYSKFSEAFHQKTNEGEAARIITEDLSDRTGKTAIISPEPGYMYNGGGYGFDGWREFHFEGERYTFLNEDAEIKSGDFENIVVLKNSVKEEDIPLFQGYELLKTEDISLELYDKSFYRAYIYATDQNL